MNNEDSPNELIPFFLSFNAESARTITKKSITETTRIPEIKQLIIEACNEGYQYLRLEYEVSPNEKKVLELDGFEVIAECRVSTSEGQIHYFTTIWW
jgi:hypothetical protein